MLKGVWLPLHDRADGQSRLAAASAAVRAGEPVTPASFFQVGGAGRIVGEKSLKLRERSREWQVGSVENVHGSLSASRATGQDARPRGDAERFTHDDFDRDDGIVFMTMELISGRSSIRGMRLVEGTDPERNLRCFS